MANLQKALDALQPYVIGIRYVDGYPVVDTLFTEGWSLPASESIEKIKGNDEFNYYMIFSKKDGIGLDELLAYVEVVIKVNIEREKKHELLKEKVNELKDIFRKTSLVKLKRLNFSFKDEDLVPELNDFDLTDIDIEPVLLPVMEDTPVVENTSIQEPHQPIYNQEPIDNDEEEEILAEEARAENFRRIKESNNFNTRVNKVVNNVELPPKRTIQAAISEDIQTDCDCGPKEACSKCIEFKDL